MALKGSKTMTAYSCHVTMLPLPDKYKDKKLDEKRPKIVHIRYAQFVSTATFYTTNLFSCSPFPQDVSATSNIQAYPLPYRNQTWSNLNFNDTKSGSETHVNMEGLLISCGVFFFFFLQFTIEMTAIQQYDYDKGAHQFHPLSKGYNKILSNQTKASKLDHTMIRPITMLEQKLVHKHVYRPKSIAYAVQSDLV